MQVFESRILTLSYDPDFGRVEAAVALTVSPGLGHPTRCMRLRTSQPLTGATPLVDRITSDAIRLAQALAV